MTSDSDGERRDDDPGDAADAPAAVADESAAATDPLTAAAFDALPAQVAVVDADGVIRRTNHAWEAFGVDNELQGDPDMIGENYLAVCDATDDPDATTAAGGLRSVLSGETDSFSFEYPCHSPDERRWFTMRAIRLPDHDEHHALVMHIDITERKEAELQVTAHNERLQTVAHVLGHDLRNPLSVVLARAELLATREALDDETVADYADTIAASASRMDDIIDDALLVAREATAVTLEWVNLEVVATDAWSHVTTDDATLAVDGTGKIRADRSLLMQLLENCFRNAVEHAGDGVAVTVSLTDDGFAVADDGPGIPAADRERVFEAGYTTNAEGGGTGLGLVILQAVADAHDWDVRVTEGAAGGARFVFDGVTIA